jgi:ribosome-binding protein aMBF1 (putative translation factor)
VLQYLQIKTLSAGVFTAHRASFCTKEKAMADNDFDWIVAGIARVITARRLELDLSQEALSIRCGLHRNYISDVERGTRNVSLKCIARLAAALEMRPSAIMQAIEENCELPPDQFSARNSKKQKVHPAN